MKLVIDLDLHHFALNELAQQLGYSSIYNHDGDMDEEIKAEIAQAMMKIGRDHMIATTKAIVTKNVKARQAEMPFQTQEENESSLAIMLDSIN